MLHGMFEILITTMKTRYMWQVPIRITFTCRNNDETWEIVNENFIVK